MWNKLFGATHMMQKGLDASWLRNEVISNNIANVDTPGFKSSKVEFENALASAVEAAGGTELKTTRTRHIRTGAEKAVNLEPVVTKDYHTAYRADGNNVDVEAEMAALAQNSLHYYTLVSKINSEFRKLNLAIRGGK